MQCEREKTYQEILVEQALVVASLPAAGVQVRERVSAVLHAVEGRHLDSFGLCCAESIDAGLQGGDGGLGSERRRSCGGVLCYERREESVCFACFAQLHLGSVSCRGYIHLSVW